MNTIKAGHNNYGKNVTEYFGVEVFEKLTTNQFWYKSILSENLGNWVGPFGTERNAAINAKETAIKFTLSFN